MGGNEEEVANSKDRNYLRWVYASNCINVCMLQLSGALLLLPFWHKSPRQLSHWLVILLKPVFIYNSECDEVETTCADCMELKFYPFQSKTSFSWKRVICCFFGLFTLIIYLKSIFWIWLPISRSSTDKSGCLESFSLHFSNLLLHLGYLAYTFLGNTLHAGLLQLSYRTCK